VLYVPELLRIKDEILRLKGPAGGIVVGAAYRMNLAWLWRDQSRTEEAERLLSSVYGRFSEGFETTDLKKAHALIDNFCTTLRTQN
jgi:predicted ATPase